MHPPKEACHSERREESPIFSIPIASRSARFLRFFPKRARHSERRGAHAPRVLFSAPSRKNRNEPTIIRGGVRKKWWDVFESSARAPPTAREARALPSLRSE